jgi:hypothetical protein
MLRTLLGLVCGIAVAVTPAPSAAVTGAPSARWRIVRVHHVPAKGAGCVAYDAGSICRSIEHWRIAFGGADLPASSKETLWPAVESFVRAPTATKTDGSAGKKVAVLICAEPTAPVAFVERVREHCRVAGVERIEVLEAADAPPRVDDIEIHVSWNDREGRDEARVGGRGPLGDAELAALVNLMRDRDREAGVPTFATVLAESPVAWGDAARVRDLCLSAGAAAATIELDALPVELKRVDPTTAGTITGTVRFEGTPPPRYAIDLSGNPECAALHREPVYSEDLVVNDGRVQYAFLHLDLEDRYEGPSTPVVLHVSGCMFEPHVLALQQGQPLRIEHGDDVLENLHPFFRDLRTGEVAEENFAMNPKATVTRVIGFAEAIGRVKSDIHPWAQAWVMIEPHPFFAVTAADGTYTIRNVPPGAYDLVMHHEKQDADQRMRVTVTTGATTQQDFVLSTK